MTMLGGGKGGLVGVDVGDIQNSLRFRGAQYLSRTFGTPTSNTSWAFSCWVKRGKFAGTMPLLGKDSAGMLGLESSDVIRFWTNAGGVAASSSALYRDPASHGHFFVRSNGTNIKGYWNNVEVISYTGTITNINSANAHVIGLWSSGGPFYLDGYLSRICFVDGGGTLTPSDFGYLNTEINEWVSKSQSACKAVVDAGGTNSFMLDFTTSTLGADLSSKGNTWTSSGHSTTAGTSCDWPCKDVPGNSYATLNPIYPSAANITNGNLSSGTTAVRATQKALDYDSKWEVTAGGSAVTAGVISSTGTTNTTTVTANKTFAFRLTAAGALDYKNVTDAGSWTSITTGLSGEQYPYGITAAATWNFGQIPLHASATWQSSAGGYFYDTTSGYKALCQANLPDPAILNSKKYFDVVTRVGTAATYSVTGIGFQPDFVWVKSRGRAVDHALYDSVRGVEKRLETNNTDAEVTGDTTGLTAFNSDGYTGGALDQINGTTATNSFVDWLWKVSPTAGFSVVTFTAPASGNSTVAHGLGKVPAMAIVKSRAATGEWSVYHQSLTTPATYRLKLNLTDAQATVANSWLNTDSTNLGYLVGTTAVASQTHVAYCFAEIPGYSKFGSYTGNGSADGPFVWCGFRPRYVLIKCTTNVSDWNIYDTARNTYNQLTDTLYADLASTGDTNRYLDITSNGFKPRQGTGYGINNAETYVFAAFADVPFKYANAR